MKKAISILIIIAVIVTSVFAISACGNGLSGKYVYKGGYSTKYFEFTSSSKVRDEYGVIATYTISGDTLTMKAFVFGTSIEQEYTLSKDRNSFSDGMKTYVKENTR